MKRDYRDRIFLPPRAWWPLAALALSACTLAPTKPAAPIAIAAPPAPAAVVAKPAPDLPAQLLAYHQTLRGMNQGELLKELGSLYLQPKTPYVTLQIALVLMLTHGGGDLARAQALLDDVVQASDAEAQPLQPLAGLLASDCAEARRYAEHADRLAVQLKETQRRTDQLNDMVEGLKAIERAQPSTATQ